MIKKWLLLSLLIFPVITIAHEGHNQTPGNLKSLHGGVVTAGKQLNLETIISGQNVTLFPISHEGLDIAAQKITVEARALPKKGKPYPIVLSSSKDGFKFSVDLNGANRLPIIVSVTSNGKTDHFTLQVEE